MLLMKKELSLLREMRHPPLIPEQVLQLGTQLSFVFLFNIMLSFIHFNMSNARIGYIFTLVLSLCVIRYELFILFLYCKVCLPCVVCIVLFIGPLHSANDSWLSMRSTNNLYQMWPLFDGSAICNIHTVMCIHLCAHLCNVRCCNKVNISCRVAYHHTCKQPDDCASIDGRNQPLHQLQTFG